MTLAAIEIEIGRELLRVLVQDVERPVQVGHKKAIGSSGFFSDPVHS